MARKRKYPGEIVRLRGSIEFMLLNSLTGEVIRHEKGPLENTVAVAGRAWILNRIGISTESHYVDRIKLGTSTATESSTHTDLQGSFSSKGLNTASFTGSTPPYFEFSASWAGSDSHVSSTAINELGLFASGTMVGRRTVTTINFSGTNTLAITYRLSN